MLRVDRCRIVWSRLPLICCVFHVFCRSIRSCVIMCWMYVTGLLLLATGANCCCSDFLLLLCIVCVVLADCGRNKLSSQSVQFADCPKLIFHGGLCFDCCSGGRLLLCDKTPHVPISYFQYPWGISVTVTICMAPMSPPSPPGEQCCVIWYTCPRNLVRFVFVSNMWMANIVGVNPIYPCQSGAFWVTRSVHSSLDSRSAWAVGVVTVAMERKIDTKIYHNVLCVSCLLPWGGGTLCSLYVCSPCCEGDAV